MDIFNLVMTRLFDGLLYPVRHLDPMWGVTMVSIPTGIILVWLFGKVSNQRLIRSLKARIKGHMLELWIFRDNTRVVLKAQANVLWNTCKYALCSLQAVVILMIPVVVIMIQLEARYGATPLKTGESVLIKIIYAKSTALADMDARIEVPEGLVLETPPLRIPGEREVDFRLGARREGSYELPIITGEQTFTKSLQVGGLGSALSPVRSGRLVDRFLRPVEPGMPAGDLASVEVRYPKQDLTLWGMEFHWLWAFFIISIATGYALRGPLGVET
jgi:hypothetical protein